MARKRARSAGVRHPGLKAVLFAVAGAAALWLVWFGITDRQGMGPWLMIGGPLALFCPLLAIYNATRVVVFRNLRSGRTAIARWTVPADEFSEFIAHEETRVGIDVNFYRPVASATGRDIDVIFSDRGVLIDGGWFPLSLDRGRRVIAVDYRADPPAIEFTTRLTTMVRTSSMTVATRNTVAALRVPVARAARGQVGEVVDKFRARLAPL